MEEPKKWTEVYPYGTKEGDDECKFFRFLSRNAKRDFHSSEAIVEGTHLSRKRVEEIIDKYAKYSPPLIFAHSSQENHWAYWENVIDSMVLPDDRSIAQKDRDRRIGNRLPKK